MEKTGEFNLLRGDSPRSLEAAKGDNVVLAMVPHGYETNINVRIVAGGEFVIAPRGCQPRKGATRRNAEPLDLPSDLIDKLKDADRRVIAWLAENNGNAKLFFDRPAEALVKAGVNLTRAEQKTIDRTHREVEEATVLAPGVKVMKLEVDAFPRGRVGRIKPGAKPQDENNDIGCAKE